MNKSGEHQRRSENLHDIVLSPMDCEKACLIRVHTQPLIAMWHHAAPCGGSIARWRRGRCDVLSM